MLFQYHTKIIETFPNTVGGVILASDMVNSSSSEALQAEYQQEQEAIKAKIANTPLSEIPALNAWRKTFRGFDVDPTKYRSAPESLLRRLTKKGDIPTINTLVDIGNLISIRYALPIAVFDTSHIQGTVTVHFADGSENYRELHSDEVIHPEVGEVVFSDEQKMVVARRWCWRQSAESASQLDTTDALITIEAQHDEGLPTVEQAVDEMMRLLGQYIGGEFEYKILDNTDAEFNLK